VSDAILAFKEVVVAFGALRAVDGVTLDVPQGERRAIIGPNGAGKTTLFNAATGVITPTAGGIRFRGRDITRLPPHRRAALGVARTFQITNLFPTLTVSENVALAVRALRARKFSLFGTARLLLPSSAGTPLKVGLVASDGANEHVADQGPAADELFRAYELRVLELARQGAAVVVLPEKTAVLTEADAARVDAGFQSLANENHVTIVVGVLRVVQRDGAGLQQLRYNQARIYSAGGPVRTYDKEHMLPPFESDLTPGTALTVMSTAAPDSAWGVAICKDMDFTELSRRYGEAGAGLLLVPAWDFFLDWIQHGHMAIMRGVESGFSVVRSAKGGSLFVSDDRGRIVAEISSNAAPFTALLTSVSQSHDKTAFLVLGDSFAWVAVVTLMCCLARLMGLTDTRVQPAPRPEATP